MEEKEKRREETLLFMGAKESGTTWNEFSGERVL